MNRERRRSIEALIEKLNEIVSEIESIQSDEQDYYDAMPESIQAGEKGDVADAAINALGEAVDQISEAATLLEDARV